MFYNKTLLDVKSKIEKQLRQDKEKYEIDKQKFYANPIKFVLEKDAKDFVDDGTVYTKDAIHKVIEKVKAVNGDLDLAAKNLIRDQIEIKVISIPERFCSKNPE